MFVIRRRQADAPNHCSHCMNLFFNTLLWSCSSCNAICSDPSLRSGHYKWFVVCHTACSSSSFLTAAPVSFATLHSFAPHFAPFHLVRSSAFASGHGLHCHHTNQHTCSHMPFRKPPYNTHWVPFRFVRRCFISVLLSPPAANHLARRRSPLRLRSACEC